MHLEIWFRRALVAVALTAVAGGALACSSTTEEEPVGTTSSSLTVAPLGARERSAFTKEGGGVLRADKGGKITRNGVVYAAAPGASGRWGFAVVDADGTLDGFRFVDAKPTPQTGDASAVRPATLHALDDQGGGGGGGGSSCNQSACNAATSAAAAAFADFVAASDDEWTALAFGLVWYSREVDKENACSSCN